MPPTALPEQPRSPTRREIATGAVQAIVLIMGAKVAKTLHLRHIRQRGPETPPPPKRKEVVPSSAENWATGELTEDKVSSFMMAFSQLKRDAVMFIDQNGNIIYGTPISVPANIAAREYVEVDKKSDCFSDGSRFSYQR